MDSHGSHSQLQALCVLAFQRTAEESIHVFVVPAPKTKDDRKTDLYRFNREPIEDLTTRLFRWCIENRAARP